VTTIHSERFADLDTYTLYALLKLRVDVFVVEQGSAYPDLDGRDMEPGTRHLWLTAADTSRPLAYLRLLTEPAGTMRIGRVVTAPEARGRGMARRLVSVALEVDPDADTVLHAQSHLVNFYTRLGFTPSGPEYLEEDGIPHVPRRRAARAGRRSRAAT
jgi:ElaA protein